MGKSLDNPTSEIFNVAKVFFILSVILAHSRVNDSSFYSAIAERLGCLGVITFFFISGYFFNISKYGVLGFFKKKITSIFIPWLFLGTLVFVFSDYPKSLNSWLNWIIGNGTYLYYLTILIFCYLLFSFFNKKGASYFFIISTIISLFLTSFDFFGYLDPYKINNYLNPFNWIGFFSLGHIMKNRVIGLIPFLNKNAPYILFFYFIFIWISIKAEGHYGYFSKLAIPNEILGMTVIFSISSLKIFRKENFIKISEFTFSIYLIHFLVFPFRIFLIQNYWSQFINPIIYMLICILLIITGKFIAKKVGLTKMYNTLIGLR
ncbi:hypothetical protein ASG38_05850 [Flavobacterium sp. Leaf359]|uniref:acyltransferase family protein n=1 Tax=Flavobacterium sp. Leaf359 TaxID=1736351 RepID=UPI0006F4018F|nr:acyltransferase [Flavobacterium sp. Leaf359]KQS48660.1 hypothetical protein ASG38_05850 [Flavobacterium sp. Leaf359]